MTGPLTQVQARWNELFPGTGRTLPVSERAEWARLVRAMGEADQQLAADAPGRRRGDATWCLVAVHMYEVLRDARAFEHLDRTTPVPCVADEAVIRGWLNAPVVAAGSPPGLTQVAGLRAMLEHDPAAAVVPTLVAGMQDVGLLGVAGQRIYLASYTGTGQDRTFVVTIDPAVPDGRTTPLLDLRDCWRPGRPVIDTIVAVLGRVAEHTTHILGNHPVAGQGLAEAPGQDREPVPDGVDAYPIGGRRPGPFPPMSTVDTPGSMQAARPLPPPGRAPGRSR